MRCEIKSGGWENSLRYSDLDAIQIIVQIQKRKRLTASPHPTKSLVAFGIDCFMVFAYSLERAGLEAVTSFSVNRSGRSMKVAFLSDPKKQCL